MDWSPEIQAKLQALFQNSDEDKIAVFDADGTLWPGDVGETFFRYQIEMDLVPGLKEIQNPFEHYRTQERLDASKAYGWLVQICAGLSEDVIRNQVSDFYKRDFKNPINPAVKNLFAEFQNRGFEVWICSASNRWSLEPAAAELNVPHDRLIATEVEVENGILTDRVIEPVPHRLGKKIQLRRRLKSAPLFVAGNSRGDLDMMALATGLTIVVHYDDPKRETLVAELELQSDAKTLGWPIQTFRQ